MDGTVSDRNRPGTASGVGAVIGAAFPAVVATASAGAAVAIAISAGGAVDGGGSAVAAVMPGIVMVAAVGGPPVPSSRPTRPA